MGSFAATTAPAYDAGASRRRAERHSRNSEEERAMEDETVICSRCKAESPPDPLIHDWEHNLATIEDARTADELVWVCPNCLTDVEKQGIQDEIEEIGRFDSGEMAIEEEWRDDEH